MKYFICKDCEDSEVCFSAVPDGITPPDICLFIKSKAPWGKVTAKEFYTKLKEVEGAKNDISKDIV